jgi:lipopolysaccharide biosynthesis protein
MLLQNRKVRAIAFYLPQFHPIPENNKWWGTGFTEWTNVAKAKPLFMGHYQPHIPADLGFYDLRLHETRNMQAEMAKTYGIEGFCYWHYWFAGKRLLETPFQEVLRSGEPDFPFCLSWANQTWTGIWHGAPDRVLIKQTYPGVEDYTAHFYSVLDAFADARYIKIDGKPVFVIYDPENLPDALQFTDLWRELAIKSGLKGLYFIGNSWNSLALQANGFDASYIDGMANIKNKMNWISRSYIDKICNKLIRRDLINCKHWYRKFLKKPVVYLYKDVVKYAIPEIKTNPTQFPCVIPNWDNTPRSGKNGIVFHNSTPEFFRMQLAKAISQAQRYDNPELQLIFIKSWNEWAEGNYLEPDLKFGRAYLEALQQELQVT